MHRVATTVAELSYNASLRARVARNLADSRPQIPHSEMERRMAERIAALKVRRTTR